ncbi:hypothetical protein [Geodermatophilus sp. DSM 45219]|uniref:hypothetical protein n=1 Tax=Geodermatophilus sp. DSM 45219 TaxID=1881103 RepID=UPI0008802555|nr:hypothetical protein [Geodermatophilus sp. DSM 45219]SDO44516.1 hypothetical protein SAMN05428965_3959 [Geodermatophilus sp. DSM 45219]
MDLDEVADELYAVPPDEFVALRRQRQDDARAAGDRTLAREVGALPKPTTAAWVANLLAREQRAEIEGLVELGGLLREAQESLAGDQLRALDRQRSQLLTALTRQATALARGRGVRVGGTVETQVADTLRAAMADPEAGEALLSGRLTGAMSYSGLGTTGSRPVLRLVPPRPEPPRERDRLRNGTAGARRRRDEDARRAAEEEVRRREEEARRREEEARRAAEERRRRELAEARAAAEEATALAAEAVAAAEEERHRVDDLDARRAHLQARVQELADELARAEREAADTAEELQRAERHRRTADRHATEATAARDRALETVRALEEG